jgi:hypothetical protein
VRTRYSTYSSSTLRIEKIDAIRTRNRRSFKAELEVIVDEAYDREFGEVDNPQQYRGV